MRRPQKLRQRRRTRAVAAAAVIVGVGVAGSAFAVVNLGPASTNIKDPNSSPPNQQTASATCTATISACTTTGTLNCSITKDDVDVNPPFDNSQYILKWRMEIKDGQTNNIRYGPPSTDGTGWKTVFVHSGSAPATQSGSTTFSPSSFSPALNSNEFYSHLQWKICDDGTLNSGGICGTQSTVVSWKC